MAKVIRKGSNKPVSIPDRVAEALVKSGRFSYVSDTSSKVSKPKSKAKAADAPSRPAIAEEKAVVEEKEASEEKEPMTMARFELAKMTNADLREKGTSLGIEWDGNETKADLVAKIVNHRYKTRMLKAEE